jgi:hypothetical protein
LARLTAESGSISVRKFQTGLFKTFFDQNAKLEKLHEGHSIHLGRDSQQVSNDIVKRYVDNAIADV